VSNSGSSPPVAPPPTILEAILAGPRTPLLVSLVLLPALGWLWIVVMARDMYGPMTGASAWMMTLEWDWTHLGLLWLMWAVMMAAMMVPSASPLLLLFGAMARRANEASPSGRIYAVAVGYVLVWALFSLGATALQRLLATTKILSPMMEVTGPRASAALLLVAGIYQLTPLKQACLRLCQSPLGFLMTRWRGGPGGAFRMGFSHGAYCVGCCWALMLLLFAGGVMNLSVIVGLTAFVLVEKLAPFGIHSARVSGVALVAAALWLLVR
jgi:predicted metal-binding membrane protein